MTMQNRQLVLLNELLNESKYFFKERNLIISYLQSANRKNANVPDLQHILQAKIGLCFSNNSNQRLKQPIHRTNVSAIANAAI